VWSNGREPGRDAIEPASPATMTEPSRVGDGPLERPAQVGDGEQQIAGYTGPSERQMLRLPDLRAGGVEGELASANARRLDDAFARVRSVLPVCAEPRGGPRRARAAGALVNIDEGAVLDAISFVARYDHLPGGRIVVSDDPTSAEPSRVTFRQTFGVFRPMLGEVECYLASGRCLAVHAVEWQIPSLYQLIADLETIGGRSCSGAALLVAEGGTYVEPDDSDHDVVVLTISGRIHLEPAAPDAQSFVMGPSDAARLPATLGATLTAVDGFATLLRITLPNGDARGDLAGMARLARFHPLLRCDVPADLASPIHSYGGSIYDDETLWQSEVANLLSTRGFENHAASVRARIAPRTDLGSGVTDLMRFLENPVGHVRSPWHAGTCVTSVDGDLRVASGGAVLDCPSTVVAAIACFLDGRPTEVDVVLDRLEECIGSATLAVRMLRVLVEAEIFEPSLEDSVLQRPLSSTPRRSQEP